MNSLKITNFKLLYSKNLSDDIKEYSMICAFQLVLHINFNIIKYIIMFSYKLYCHEKRNH